MKIVKATASMFIFLAVYLLSVSSASAGLPAIPVISATAGDSSATITWPAASGATGYNLFWSTDPGINIKNKFNMKVPGVTSPFTQTQLTNGITYYFIVNSVNKNGESYGSNVVSVVPGKPCPEADKLQSEIDNLFALYSTLTGKKDAGRRQQVKAQIISLTAQMQAARANCNK